MIQALENAQKSFAQLFIFYYKKARLSKIMLAKMIGIKDPKSLRGWESGKYAPNEENVYKLINIFFQWGVISNLEQARELWQTACEERCYKGYSDAFQASKVNPSSDVAIEGEIYLIKSPQLSIVNPQINEDVIATFSIRNTGQKTVFIKEMAMCCRLGDTWEGKWADFPHVKNIRVKPGGEYHYQKQQKFSVDGSYFCEAVAIIEGVDRWLGIPQEGDVHYPRIYFNVSQPG